MSDESPRLVDLARSISGGVPVDWEKATREARGAEESEQVRELMEIERIFEAHRADNPLSDEAERPLQATERPDASGVAPPLRRWGPLVLIETIGRGAFGEVILAHDPTLDRQVALKLLHADAGISSLGDAVIEEGRLMARVRHPNVVTVHGAERYDDRVGLWMEFIHGEPLSQILAERGVLGAQEAGLIGLDLCRALAAVHRAGLVHHDVKAQNVMRERGGRIVLMDFGAGRDTAAPGASRGPVSGTPLYMPPEVFLGDRADHRGDIYALGILLFHLVTWTFPIVAETLDDLRRAHLSGAVQPLSGLRPDLPPAFVRVVEKALSSDPSARFESAAAMEQALAAALGVQSGETSSAHSGRPRSLRPAATVLAVVAIVAVASGVYLALRPPKVTMQEAADAVRVAPAQPVGAAVPMESAGPSSAPSAAPSANAASPFVPKGAYSVEASVFRGTTAAARLEQGDRVRVGDALSIRMKVSRPLWVYVVDEDDQGVASLLFPLPASDLRNPLPPGEWLLPGRIGAEQKYWKITSAGGREHFLLVASPKRLVDFERETAALPRPTEDGQGAYVTLSEPAKEQLRGITGLESGPAPRASAGGGRLFEIAKELEARSEVVRGPWVRRVDLENPAR